MTTHFSCTEQVSDHTGFHFNRCSRRAVTDLEEKLDGRIPTKCRQHSKATRDARRSKQDARRGATMRENRKLKAREDLVDAVEMFLALDDADVYRGDWFDQFSKLVRKAQTGDE